MLDVTVTYIYPGKKFWREATRFVETYDRHPPEYPHRIVVLVNGCDVDNDLRELFFPVTVYFVKHDNSGWDIGAWMAFSKLCEGVMVCLGASVYFWKDGWLAKLAKAREAEGAGMYGVSGSYEKRPHINTTAFMVDAYLLRQYPNRVVTWRDRYEFEHGKNSFMSQLKLEKIPVNIVTWSGVTELDQWRVEPNIFRRGDQSNLLLKWNHTDIYDQASALDRRRLSDLADGKMNSPVSIRRTP